MTITSSQIKLIRSLKDKKFRDEEGLFVVEGEKLVQEALDSGYYVESVFRSSEIGEKAMERISLLNSPSPALAIVRKPVPEDNVILENGGLYLALDSIRDPGNMGTILRLADWFGIDAVLASKDSVDIFNPKVVQSTMGAIFRVKFHYCDLVPVFKNSNAEIFGTFLKGDSLYAACLDSDRPRVIVIGNEANGISSGVSECCTLRLTIPSFAKGNGSESLNAAIATAITVSEFRRRSLPR